MKKVDIIKKIRDEMVIQNISSKEMAEATGFTKRYIQYIKNGKYKDIKTENANKILQALGLTIIIERVNQGEL